MQGATALSASGGVRTRRKSLAAASHPSSSADSQHTFEAAVQTSPTPDSNCSAVQAISSRLRHNRKQSQAATACRPRKVQQQLPHKTTTMPSIASAGGRPAAPKPTQDTVESAVRNQTHQQQPPQQQLQDQGSNRTRLGSPAVNTRSRTSHAATTNAAETSVRNAANKESSKGSAFQYRLRCSSSSKVEAEPSASAADTHNHSMTVDTAAAVSAVSKQFNLQEKQQQRQRLTGTVPVLPKLSSKQTPAQRTGVPAVVTRRRSRLSDCSSNPQVQHLQAAASQLAVSQQQDVSAAAIAHAAAAAAVQAAVAAVREQDGSDTSMQPAPIQPDHTGAPAMVPGTAEAASADDIPPTSLRARFARLSAEQQLSILLQLEELTQVEDARRAKQAARRAAAEAREREKDAVRGQERRSARNRKLPDCEGQDLNSRSGTPDYTPNTPDPTSTTAADCSSPSPGEAVLQELQLQAATTGGTSSPACVATVSAARANSRVRAERGDLSQTGEPEYDGAPSSKRARTDAGVSSVSPEPEAAAVSFTGKLCRPGDCAGHVIRPVYVRRLGSRAQARKGSNRRGVGAVVEEVHQFVRALGPLRAPYQ